MPNIHESAIVHPSAEIDDDVVIGPFCLIEERVKIGSGSRLLSNVIVQTGTTLGKNNEMHAGCVLGGTPQDRKFQGEISFLVIGNDNIFRECVTIHRASGEGMTTIVGDDNYLMAYSHLGHNCIVDSHITIANGTGISGHVHIEDYVNIGGLVGVHQKVRIGKLAMIAAMSRVPKDVPPFMLFEGHPASVKDINSVGLRRMGVSSEERLELHRASKLIFRSQLPLSKAIEELEASGSKYQQVSYLIDFMKDLKNGRYGRGLDSV